MTQTIKSHIKEKNQNVATKPSVYAGDTSLVPWWLGGGRWYQAYEKIKMYMGLLNTSLATDYPQYSINLIWINRKLQTSQTYIYPSEVENDKKYFNTIITWAKKNPDSTIHLWFDSRTTQPEAVKNTQAAFNEEVAKFGKNIAKIELNNIRDLSIVKKNPDIFSENMPVYFRADLLRAVLAEEILRQNKTGCFVYTDFDVKPLTKAELFDKKTLENLKKYHFVMAKETNRLGFENSFQIFTYDETLLKAASTMLIEANLMRARSFLEELRHGNFFAKDSMALKIYRAGHQENIFYSYPLMYAYWAQLQNKEPLFLPCADKPFDEKRDASKLDEITQVIMLRSSAKDYIARFPIPTKQISIPPTTSFASEF